MKNANDLRKVTDEELVRLYDEYIEKKTEIDRALKAIREEAARRLNERHVQSITYIDPETDTERGFEWSQRSSRSVNYELLKAIVGDKYFDIVTENTSTFVKFVKRKREKKSVPNFNIPEGTIV